MIRKILIASEGAALSENAVRSAIELARATGASVLGLMVTEPFPLNMYGDLMLRGVEPVQQFHDHERELAQRLLAPIERAAASAGISYIGSSVSSRSAADAIVATAEHEGCDLICIAPHNHRDRPGVHLGKEAAKVLTHARVPVLVCQ